MNILFLTTTLPRDARTGSECVSQCLIDSLEHHGHAVWVVGYQRQQQRYTPTAREINVGQRYIETSGAKAYPVLWMGLAFVKNLPYCCAKYYSKAYLRAVQTCIQENAIDLVVLDHMQLAWAVEVLPTQVPLVLVAHNIEHQPYQLQQQGTRNPLARWIYGREATLVQQIQDRLAAQVPEIWTLTTVDQAYFAGVATNGNVRQFDIPFSVAPAPIATPAIAPPAPPDPVCDIAILGSWTWGPNAEGLRWFFDTVYPLLATSVRIRVAGKGADWLTTLFPPVAVDAGTPEQVPTTPTAASPTVEYCGFVPSAADFLRQAKIVAIPSVSGSGIQIKTLEAIALGVPIVATPTALRGIDQPPASVQWAESPDAFATALMQAIAQPPSATAAAAALTWTMQRRETFLGAIATALAALSSHR
jgi:polysaccharide biosynthesis protein PslH